MRHDTWLSEQFEANRALLKKVAVRMLGSSTEADDALQEAWLRITSASPDGVENVGGWLRTVLARVCLDHLRARTARKEDSVTVERPAPDDLEAQTVLADALGPAMGLVLERLQPAERVAFVLHDLFELTFDEIAPIVDRSVVATRQLASRARRRVQGQPPVPEAEVARHRELVDAFFAASRGGDLQQLLTVIAPDVELKADAMAVSTARANQLGALPAPALRRRVVGANEVLQTFKGRANGAQAMLIDGEAGAAWQVGGVTRSAFVFTFDGDRVVEIHVVMDLETLARLDVRPFS